MKAVGHGRTEVTQHAGNQPGHSVDQDQRSRFSTGQNIVTNRDLLVDELPSRPLIDPLVVPTQPLPDPA